MSGFISPIFRGLSSPDGGLPSPATMLRHGFYRLGAGGVLGLRSVQSAHALTVHCAQGSFLCVIRVQTPQGESRPDDTVTMTFEYPGTKKVVEFGLVDLAQYKPDARFERLFDQARAEVLSLLSPSPAAPLAAEGVVSSGEDKAATAAPGDTSAAEFRNHRVARDGQPDLAFRGKLLASARSAHWNGRAWVLEVYETPGGNYVTVKRGLSLLPGEIDTAQAFVTNTKGEIPAALGYSRLAKTLYASLGLDAVESVG